jgi:DNA-directed RNA polymerase sigma subunit (sigma70/sigma32)
VVLVKLGTTSAQKKLFFNLRKAKARIGALEDGDLRPENVKRIAHDLGVTEDEVISMNRRLSGGDASLNARSAAEARQHPVAGLARGRGRRPGRGLRREGRAERPSAARCWITTRRWTC